MKKRYAGAVLLAAALSVTACSSTQTTAADTIKIENAEDRVISVSATETVKVVPDIAQIVYGVTTQADDAETCQRENAAKVGQVADLLKDMGIEENSIQTSGYGLNPRYDWSSNTQVLVGYEMTTLITVSDLELDQVGVIINDSVSAGINDIQSVTYQSSQYKESYQEALKLAVENAKAKAQAMAEAGGFTLGGISHIDEYSSESQAYYTNYSLASARSFSAEDSSSGSVLPGQVDVEARIGVEFLIEN